MSIRHSAVAAAALVVLLATTGCVPHFNDDERGFFVLRENGRVLFGYVGSRCEPADATIAAETIEVYVGGNLVWALRASSTTATVPAAIELGLVPDGYEETARDQAQIDRIVDGEFDGMLGISEVQQPPGRKLSGSVNLLRLPEAGPSQGVFHSYLVDRTRLICDAPT